MFDGCVLKIDDGTGPFYDDLTKQQLPTELVKIARRKEPAYFESKEVWKRVSIAEAWKVWTSASHGSLGGRQQRRRRISGHQVEISRQAD